MLFAVQLGGEKGNRILARSFYRAACCVGLFVVACLLATSSPFFQAELLAQRVVPEYIVYAEHGRNIDYLDNEGKLQTVVLATPPTRVTLDGGDHYLRERPTLVMIRGKDLSRPTVITYQ